MPWCWVILFRLWLAKVPILSTPMATVGSQFTAPQMQDFWTWSNNWWVPRNCFYVLKNFLSLSLSSLSLFLVFPLSPLCCISFSKFPTKKLLWNFDILLSYESRFHPLFFMLFIVFFRLTAAQRSMWRRKWGKRRFGKKKKDIKHFCFNFETKYGFGEKKRTWSS